MTELLNLLLGFSIFQTSEVPLEIVGFRPTVRDLIDWKVGDKQTHRALGSHGMSGHIYREITKEVVGADNEKAVWYKVNSIFDGGGGMQVEFLMRRSDGKILQVKENGFSVDPKEYEESLNWTLMKEHELYPTMAGKFDCSEYWARNSDGTKMNICVNDVDLSLGGTVFSDYRYSSGATLHVELVKVESGK